MDDADKKFLDDHIKVVNIASAPNVKLHNRRATLHKIKDALGEIEKQASYVSPKEALLDDAQWRQFLLYAFNDAGDLVRAVADAQEEFE